MCINIALAGNLKADNKWNADSTTFSIVEHGTESKVCIVRDPDLDLIPRGPTRSMLPSSLPVYLRWIHLCSAAGELSPLVFMIAIDDLSEDDFFTYPVQGLSSTNGNTICGHLVFTKSRAGNQESWMWWFQHICIPTINLTKNLLQHKVYYSI